MITDAQVNAYKHDGCLVVADVPDAATLTRLRDIIAPALHGSTRNVSDRPRNLLLYKVAISDAWPLAGVKDLAEHDSRLLAGSSVTTPRMEPVPVRMPLPPAARQGSIYENQASAARTYFERHAA